MSVTDDPVGVPHSKFATLDGLFREFMQNDIGNITIPKPDDIRKFVDTEHYLIHEGYVYTGRLVLNSWRDSLGGVAVCRITLPNCIACPLEEKGRLETKHRALSRNEDHAVVLEHQFPVLSDFAKGWLGVESLSSSRDTFVSINGDASSVLDVFICRRGASLHVVYEAYWPEGTVEDYLPEPVASRGK